ncbi:MAG: methyltransferase domain-containing protein [Burkholderiaceae bacterium]|nr:methyltransferase domain-containing protein [Burkholderiaceae bacterium]
MKLWELDYFVSPKERKSLALKGAVNELGEVDEGVLHAGAEFNIVDGVPNFLLSGELSDKALSVASFYDGRSETYDQYLHLTFFTHGEDETKVRNGFADLLELTRDSTVLEVAAGSGRDSEIIAQRLGAEGKLFLQDLSPGMLAKARERMHTCEVPTSFSISDASALPYPDHTFDAVFSFGGLGEFPDIRGALAEMVRVCKPGGKVVVGDESIPVWLRSTEFAKILSTTNPQFMAPLPLEHMPVQAREVCVRWVIGGVFYLIDFRVAEGPPTGNFDYPIPGPRGGTLRSRYEGQLEGVSVEAKEMAHQARQRRGMSMHAWLEEAVRKAAASDLG